MYKNFKVGKLIKTYIFFMELQHNTKVNIEI